MQILLSKVEKNKDFVVELIEDEMCQKRLYEMGITPGVSIKKLFSAPGGCPSAFLINEDYVLGLRKEESDQIKVKQYGK